MKKITKNFYLIICILSIVLYLLSFKLMIIKMFNINNIMLFIFLSPTFIITSCCIIFSFYKISILDKVFTGFKPKYISTDEKTSKKDLLLGLVFLFLILACILTQVFFIICMHHIYNIHILYKIIIDILYGNNIFLLLFSTYRMSIE
jgi:hypothetical protein